MAQIVNPLPTGPTDAAQIAAFETHIGHPLPPAYREFLLTHNGGHPEPDAFTLPEELGGEENVVHCFFPLRDPAVAVPTKRGPDGLRVWPLVSAWDDLQNDYGDQVDPPLLPVGTDGSGNYFCVVLTGPTTGAVVFFEHEMGEPYPLADGFPAFLESLRPRVRTDYAE